MEESPAMYEQMNKRIPVKDGDNNPEMYGREGGNPDEDSYGDEELDDLDDLSQGELDAATGKRRARRRRKAPKKVYRDPTEKDILMARAYGGAAKGSLVRKHRVQTSTSTLKIKGNDKERLSKLAGSVSGFHREHSEVMSQRSTHRRRSNSPDRFGERGPKTEDGNSSTVHPRKGNFMT